MKRFADSVARQKRIKPPVGYTKSASICRAFLDRHAPKNDRGEAPGEKGSKLPSPAQVSFAERIAREKGVDIPDEAKTSSVAVSAWIASNQSDKRSGGRGETPRKSTGSKSMAHER
jgi:DNA topoisomerase-3